MSVMVTTQPVDFFKFVFDGFRSIPELWDMSTPELLRTEVRNLTLTAQKSNWDGQRAFLAGQKRATELYQAFKAIQDREQRKIDRADQKKREALIETERQVIAEQAKVELEEIVTRLQAQDNLSAATKYALQYFRYVYLEGKRDLEIAGHFKGSTRDQRYQWKKRAIDLIEPLASVIAKKYISERTNRKFASVQEIDRYADIFLFKTMETL